jgi:hypothetical protein
MSKSHQKTAKKSWADREAYHKEKLRQIEVRKQIDALRNSLKNKGRA